MCVLLYICPAKAGSLLYDHGACGMLSTNYRSPSICSSRCGSWLLRPCTCEMRVLVRSGDRKRCNKSHEESAGARIAHLSSLQLRLQASGVLSKLLGRSVKSANIIRVRTTRDHIEGILIHDVHFQGGYPGVYSCRVTRLFLPSHRAGHWGCESVLTGIAGQR